MNSMMAPNVKGVGSPGRRTVYSMCGMCAVRCPMEVTVENGRVSWLQGNPNDKALGHSLCAKGSAGLALEYDDQRPQTPLIRVGARGEGRWRRASWDEALDYIADKLKETIAEFGGRGIALSDRSGPFVDLTKTFLQALGSPNYCNHDASCGGNVHNASRSLLGFSHAALINDLKHAKHLVLYGRNIVESIMVKEAKAFMAARSNGMRCTYIDPRASITACKSTRYWQVRPNSDYALNLAIIHEVLKQDLYDKAFVAKHVLGMDSLREAVKDTTPEWQESHTGIAAAELRAFVAEIAADAPHVIFHPGWMTSRHKQSFYVSRTALILNALMGNIEVPGGCIVAKPPEFYGRKGLKRLAQRVPTVDEPRVDGAGTTRPSWDPAIGMLHQLFSAMETSQPYGIGAYFAYRHDPLTAMPDTEAVKRALDHLKLIVSIDVRYSETGWFSDVILPESTYLERANILCQMNGPVPVIAMRDQVIAPRFDSRPAWWIFREILSRMDLKEVLDFETIEELWDYQLEGTGVTVAEMRETGIVSLADAVEADASGGSPFPDTVWKNRDRERNLETGWTCQPATLRAQDRSDRRPFSSGVRTSGDACARPVVEQSAASPNRAETGVMDSPRPCGATRHRRWRRSGNQWRRRVFRPPASQSDTMDPSRSGFHAARLWSHGAACHAGSWRRCGRSTSATWQTLRL